MFDLRHCASVSTESHTNILMDRNLLMMPLGTTLDFAPEFLSCFLTISIFFFKTVPFVCAERMELQKLGEKFSEAEF